MTPLKGNGHGLRKRELLIKIWKEKANFFKLIGKFKTASKRIQAHESIPLKKPKTNLQI